MYDAIHANTGHSENMAPIFYKVIKLVKFNITNVLKAIHYFVKKFKKKQ